MSYISEDGHEFKKEDFESYAIWKIRDLKELDYSEQEVLFFDDNVLWVEFVKRYIKCV